MSDHPQRELAPMAALGALDGESLLEWNTHVAQCEDCRQELLALEGVAGSIGAATATEPPSPDLRRRVLAAAGSGGPREAAPLSDGLRSTGAVRTPRRPAGPLLAAAAGLFAVVFGGAALLYRFQRDGARQEAADLRDRLGPLEARDRADRVRIAELELRLAEQAAFTTLFASEGTRTTTLAGLTASPGARGTMIWNPAHREAILIAAGLPPAPAGKTYELWVIAGRSPVPAGLFQTDAQGTAMFRMPWVEEASRAATFAVTIEPAQGVPAPTGTMVLAGKVS